MTSIQDTEVEVQEGKAVCMLMQVLQVARVAEVS